MSCIWAQCKNDHDYPVKPSTVTPFNYQIFTCYTTKQQRFTRSQQSVIHLLPRHGLPDLCKNEGPHVLKLILEVSDVRSKQKERATHTFNMTTTSQAQFLRDQTSAVLRYRQYSKCTRHTEVADSLELSCIQNLKRFRKIIGTKCTHINIFYSVTAYK